MIGYLKGSVIDISRNCLIINCSGVGYEVFCTHTLVSKSEKKDLIELYIYTHVKEDQLKLFGFETRLEKDLFETIIGVSGVGPKIGLAIIGAGEVNEIKKAISKADVGFFTKIKGLGKKGAQKIIIELKNKLGSINELDLTSDDVGDQNSDLVEALLGLGFRKADIMLIIPKIDTNQNENEQIRQGLQLLGK